MIEVLVTLACDVVLIVLLVWILFSTLRRLSRIEDENDARDQLLFLMSRHMYEGASDCCDSDLEDLLAIAAEYDEASLSAKEDQDPFDKLLEDLERGCDACSYFGGSFQNCRACRNYERSTTYQCVSSMLDEISARVRAMKEEVEP